MSGIIGAERGDYGRVTLFDIRDPVTEHAHPHLHFLFKVEGRDRGLAIEGRTAILGDDNCLLISPWQPHADIPQLCTDQTLMLALYIEPAYLEARYGSLGYPAFLAPSGELSPGGRSLVVEISERLSGDRASPERIEAAILALVDEAMRAAPSAQRSGPFDFRIRRAMTQLREAPQLHPDFVRVASNVGLSRSRFFEQFKNSLGIAPTMYLDGLLLERAIALLVQTDDPIERISAHLGFSAPSSFSRFFRHRVGFPPAVLRHAGRLH